MKNKPKVTILIVSLNSKRTIQKCLNYIKSQDYPNIDEVLLVDGGSTDNTLELAKKIGLKNLKILKAGYKDNQEARRAIGIEKAKNEYIAMIDTDNYLLSKTWISDLVEPLVKHTDVIASQTLRYAAPKDAPLLNRYFGLLGGADPISYYLGKSDRLSFAKDTWDLRGDIVSENNKYYIIRFTPNTFPSVGANGILFKKSMLMESHWGKPENYFHTDVFVDIAKKYGSCKFAIVKNETYHDTAETLTTFFSKRTRYMSLHHHNLKATRRYFIFNPKNPSDVIKLGLCLLYAVTFIVPLFESIYGFIKKRDIAWFIHPYVTFMITFAYAKVTIYNVLNN